MAWTYPESPAFEGRLGRTLAESRPAWLRDPRPPSGAPNVVIVLTDDLGFSDIGCFGSEIATPNLDRLADRGVRYSNFHATPLCSPTRAALLTGVNAHAAGLGSVSNSGDGGFPGKRGELAENVITAAEVFRDNGYATFMVGKWHLTGPTHLDEGAPRASWPLQRGFDRFYGFLGEGFTSYHHPNMLVKDNHIVEVDEYPDGYYLTDDLTDQAVKMIQAAKVADDRRPFFLYFAHGAVHAPIHAKADDMATYARRYDRGWDVVREERLAKQKQLGVVSEGTRLAPRNIEADMDVAPWDELDDRERRVFARHMEAYAAMVDNIDQSLGRLLDAVHALDELDNTIVIFTSDNGASKEGGSHGTTEYLRVLTKEYLRVLAGQADGNDSLDRLSFNRDQERIDWIGGPRAQTHYPRGWAMACNTPFRLYKCTTFAGAHQVPFILSWPSRVTEHGAIRSQYAHVTDVLPTLIDLIGLHRPDHRRGIAALPMNGASLAETITDPLAASAHVEQYYEWVGHRAFYRDGWEIVALHSPGTPISDEEWQLFHTAVDPTQLDELSDTDPERLKELISGWDDAAWTNNVYPIGGMGVPSPDLDELADRAVTLTPTHHTLERVRSSLLIFERSFAVDVALLYRQGDEGIVFAHGDQAGGYALYVEDGRLVFAHNGFGEMTEVDAGSLAEGTAAIRVEVDAPGGGVWNVAVVVDGAERVRRDGLDMVCGPLSPFEGIDVGIDRRSPVCWDLHARRGPFRYTGELRAATFIPGEAAPDASQRQISALRESLLRFD